jgi:hypothetical protein
MQAHVIFDQNQRTIFGAIPAKFCGDVDLKIGRLKTIEKNLRD